MWCPYFVKEDVVYGLSNMQAGQKYEVVDGAGMYVLSEVSLTFFAAAK